MALPENPNPEITYHYLKNKLQIISTGTFTYKNVDLLEIYSPLNFQQKDLPKDYDCRLSLVVGGGYFQTGDLTIKRFVLTFNNNYRGASYELKTGQMQKRYDKPSFSYFFTTPAEFFRPKDFGQEFNFKL